MSKINSSYFYALIIYAFFLCTFTQQAKSEIQKSLAKCLEKYKILDNSFLEISYKNENKRLYHSFEPWQYYTSKSFGKLYISNSQFFMNDTLKSKNLLYSVSHFNDSTLEYQDYGDTLFQNASKIDYDNQKFYIARFCPTLLVQYFAKHADSIYYSQENDLDIMQLEANSSIFKLFSDSQNNRIEKITKFYHHDIYGDVCDTIFYLDFIRINQIDIAQKIVVSNILGKTKDSIELANFQIIPTIPQNLNINKIFKKSKKIATSKDTISKSSTLTKLNPHIYLIEFPSTSSQSMLVEFASFFVAINSPLSIENGEEIIKYAKSSNSNKEIKYFVAGHFHPHYLGGLRAFVHNKSTILGAEANADYIQFLANNSHSLKQDNLEKSKNKIRLLNIKDSLLIIDSTDSSVNPFRLQIYNIAANSNHCKDFFIFYFPSLNLLFEDELIWIKKDAPLEKASKRQIGLYESIKQLNLKVDNIIQSWPLGDKYNVKSNISFEELENSVKQNLNSPNK
jgi:hypothetical protein